MVVRMQEVFQPEAWNAHGEDWPPVRRLVHITIPCKILTSILVYKGFYIFLVLRDHGVYMYVVYI